jgi:threonine/homoserine/homoserine lactone efflux protein
MTVESTVGFALAMLILAATPGPGVFASVAQTLSSGFRSSLCVIAGIITGDLFFLTLAIFGLSAVAHALGELFFIVKIAGGAYLIWLGYRMWTAEPASLRSSRGLFEQRDGWQRYLGGLFITLSNPKVILFYCGFLPTFMELRSLALVDITIVAGVVATVLAVVIGMYSYFADRARRLFTGGRSARALNRGAGTVLIGTGVIIATR